MAFDKLLTSKFSGKPRTLDQYLVQQGYMVSAVGGRGREGRGTAFQKPAYRALGGVEATDQFAGLAWLKKQTFVDPGKVAVFGWSYGGYMALKLLEAAPHAYAAGIAVVPVVRWDLYDTTTANITWVTRAVVALPTASPTRFTTRPRLPTHYYC